MIDSRDIIRLLQDRVPSRVAVYHYGSTALGGWRPDSDVDLGVLAESPVPSDVLFEVEVHVATLLERARPRSY